MNLTEAATRGVLWPKTLLRLWYRCFPVNFVKFLRTSFLQNTFGRLLLTRATGNQIYLSVRSNIILAIIKNTFLPIESVSREL